MRLVFSLFLLIYGCGCSTGHNKANIFDRFAKEFHKEMKKEFGLFLVRQKMHAAVKLKGISFDYCHYKPAEILQARLLIHKLTDSFLEKVNKNPSLRIHLDHYPMTAEDIEVSISFLDPKTHKAWSKAPLTHASLLSGKIHYCSYLIEEGSVEKVLQEAY